MIDFRVGDCREVLRTIDDGVIHLCVTSPPYLSLRDYDLEPTWWGVTDPSCLHELGEATDGYCARCGAWRGVLGLEPSIGQYVANVVEVFAEVHRVLHPEGVVFLNLGDSMARDPKKGQHKPGDLGKQAYVYDRGGGRASSTISLRQACCDGRSAGSRGTAGRGSRGCQGDGSTSIRLCDGCQASLSNRIERIGGRLVLGSDADEGDPTRERSQSPDLCLDDSGSAHRQQSAQSGHAMLDRRQTLGPVDELPHASRGSTIDESWPPPPGECWHCDNCDACLCVLHSASRESRACARREERTCGTSLQASGSRSRGRGASFLAYPDYTIEPRLKPKDLCMVPHRVAMALQEWGWFVRDEIVWAKSNVLPASVKDRTTRQHEFIFMLTKSPRYFYDEESIREPALNTPGGRLVRADRGERGCRKKQLDGAAIEGRGLDVCASSSTRRPRSVWEIAVQPLREKHFAAFPEALVERCILAGTSERGCCPTCGKQWRRIVEKGESDEAHQRACGADLNGSYDGENQKDYESARAQAASDVKRRILASLRKRKTTGWRPACRCGGEPLPSIVLDPFSGSGRTGLVAKRLGRAALLIDAKADYVLMAKQLCGEG